jgi:hypothetical protein
MMMPVIHQDTATLLNNELLNPFRGLMFTVMEPSTGAHTEPHSFFRQDGILRAERLKHSNYDFYVRKQRNTVAGFKAEPCLQALHTIAARSGQLIH